MVRLGRMSAALNYPLEDAPALLTLAREDIGLSRQALASRAGVDVSVVADIEAGKAAGKVNRDTLKALLIAAELRPAVPLGFYASKLRDVAGRLGIDSVRVFGSTVHGLDIPSSDVDFLVTLADDASSFALAGFQMEAERILGFPVDVMLEAADSPVGDRARAEAVSL